MFIYLPCPIPSVRMSESPGRGHAVRPFHAHVRSPNDFIIRWEPHHPVLLIRRIQRCKRHSGGESVWDWICFLLLEPSEASSQLTGYCGPAPTRADAMPCFPGCMLILGLGHAMARLRHTLVFALFPTPCLRLSRTCHTLATHTKSDFVCPLCDGMQVIIPISLHLNKKQRHSAPWTVSAPFKLQLPCKNFVGALLPATPRSQTPQQTGSSI